MFSEKTPIASGSGGHELGRVTEDSIRHQSLNSALKDSTNLDASDCTALSSLERGKRCGLSHEDIQWSQPRRHKVVSATEDIKWSQPQDVKVVSATEDTQWSQPQDVKVVLFVSTSPKTVSGSPTDLCSIRLSSF
ncbi:hypothetical protein PROFUN_14456 [Planoprotostelium fungivorum]|uniref:Uncharacterized protein n=1 Tax=Planoprotostelium fungivorum TaxID=1890364 RepID=A0A2P6MXB8_9EUKA|nr:hypothetical protein PROFUN_14456 [Planoprotostelium fungivorum]